MIISDYLKNKQGFESIYKAAKDELENMDEWYAYEGKWRLLHIGICSDGSLTAVVKFHYQGKIQWIGLSWENILSRLNGA